MHHPEVYLKVICLLSPGSKLDATTVMLILIKFRSQQPRQNVNSDIIYLYSNSNKMGTGAFKVKKRS